MSYLQTAIYDHIYIVDAVLFNTINFLLKCTETAPVIGQLEWAILDKIKTYRNI